MFHTILSIYNVDLRKLRLMNKYPPVNKMNDGQRIEIVQDIFATVTEKYDFLNRFLSLRRDVYWRKKTIEQMSFIRNRNLLDVATGTADIALECAKYHKDVQVQGVDFVQRMIDFGRKKATSMKLQDQVKLDWGDATQLDFSDNSFDVCSMAFGIRNIPDKIKALNEMQRVIVPGGQVVILELTTPEPGFWRRLYNFYLNGLLPRLAKVFSKNPSAYEYLADSIMNFPTRKEFVQLLESIGLIDCKAIPLTLGVCTIYIGNKKSSEPRGD
jgi:demethylmenaquinone methyltransferase / 2-methoxy-6-polyprenyl-1,4-benzoquinol methylase